MAEFSLHFIVRYIQRLARERWALTPLLMMLSRKVSALSLFFLAFLAFSVLAEVEPKVSHRGIGSLSTSEIEEQLQVCCVVFQS